MPCFCAASLTPQSRRARSPCRSPCRPRAQRAGLARRRAALPLVLPRCCLLVCVFALLLPCCCALVALYWPTHLLPRALTPTRPRALPAQTDFGPLALALASFARPMAFYVLFALLALCSSQTTSPTTSPSPTPTPCSAPPGYFCSGGSALICPIGAYCAGGSALNVSCYPVTACTVAGLSAQPPCFWNVSTYAGNGLSSSTDGIFSSASFFLGPQDVLASSSGIFYAVERNNNRVRKLAGGSVSTLASFGVGQCPTFLKMTPMGSLVVSFQGALSLQYINTSTGSSTSAATINYAAGLDYNSTGFLFIAAQNGNTVSSLSPSGILSVFAGSGSATPFSDGAGTIATFNSPRGLAVGWAEAVFVADCGNNRVRAISPMSFVSTFAGSGYITPFSDGAGTSATFNCPAGLFFDALAGLLFVSDNGNNRVRSITIGGIVTTIAGSGLSAFTDGMPKLASFSSPYSLSVASGSIYVADQGNLRIRKLTCIPCPSGTFISTTGSTSCQQCPGGHYCPTGTSSWARLNCGRGNYCPDGSGAPSPCPFQVPPTGGWGALQVQGPAFLVETAHCLNHCFWNFTSGDGMLSKC